MRVLLGLALLLAVPPDATSAEPYTSPDLPPVLRFIDGTGVTTTDQWPARRREIARLWCETYLGSFPEETPALLEATTLDETPATDGGPHTVRNVRLVFDTPNRASFEIRLLIPSEKHGHYPLLLTQPRHYQIAWGEAAVRRGYVVCFYPGVDYNHQEKGFPNYQNAWRVFKNEYPEATWSSSLAIQSWLAGRALDYLLSDRFDRTIAPSQVGIIGHSRYGKQSLYAAAFDQRIQAVVSRSAGSPAAAGYRFTGRDTFMETVIDAPAEWALPGVRDYFGRENHLPVESNGLLALIAPRACLIHTAHNDGSDPTFAVERTYREAKTAYQLLGAADKISLQYRTGNHNPITPEHVAMNLDWFDWTFARGTAKRSDFPETLLHAFDHDAWKSAQHEASPKPPTQDATLAERVTWLLGEQPPEFTRTPVVSHETAGPGVATWSRDRWKPDNVTRLPVSFGHNVHGNLMFPTNRDNPDKPLPVVVWLHPFNYSHGANEGYGVEGTTIYYRLAQAGYAVLAYDQCGFGDRLLEGAEFYKKFPRWSKMGRMVFDARSALDFVTGAGDGLPPLDAGNVTLLGYSLGGMVALHTAALDDRVTAAASFCSFTPMRTDHGSKPTGGIRRWWDWHALLPKLGNFESAPAELPYDYGDLLKAIAPRPCLVYSATRDRHVDPVDVAACLARSASPTLKFIHADEVNRFQSKQHQLFVDWLDAQP